MVKLNSNYSNRKLSTFFLTFQTIYHFFLFLLLFSFLCIYTKRKNWTFSSIFSALNLSWLNIRPKWAELSQSTEQLIHGLFSPIQRMCRFVGKEVTAKHQRNVGKAQKTVSNFVKQQLAKRWSISGSLSYRLVGQCLIED